VARAAQTKRKPRTSQYPYLSLNLLKHKSFDQRDTKLSDVSTFHLIYFYLLLVFFIHVAMVILIDICNFESK